MSHTLKAVLRYPVSGAKELACHTNVCFIRKSHVLAWKVKREAAGSGFRNFIEINISDYSVNLTVFERGCTSRPVSGTRNFHAIKE